MIDSFLDMVLNHDKVVIATEINSKVNSKESLDRLLRIIMNYVGEDNYIEHTDDYEFDVFVNAHKHKNKRIISTTLNVWLSNTDIKDHIFDNVKFILPYKDMLKLGGLPHFPGNRSSIPTRLMYSSDLVMVISGDTLTFLKIRNAKYFDRELYLPDLFLCERNIKVDKLKKLIA